MKKIIINIGTTAIGGKNPCFIIAEAGVNHNGDLALAKKLVDAAKEAGADAVKFQTFKAQDLITERADMAEYQKKNTGKRESQLAMLKKLELPYEDFPLLKNYCDARGIMFLSTAHTGDAAAFLEPFMPGYKIASGDLTNIPFLEYVAKRGKPIILSTGMGTLEEVKEAVKAIEKKGNKKIILLHCTTNYPCPLEEVNLRAMQTLQKTFPYPVGYSDHTE
ncbi:MAG: N-acetylneuraminate synthase family protein, partial [Candidatus Portnoybacteria bacterium]|nr:N-acetylneuraminate synthase family protein [Candidatus Portnoybacteria bacterium]